MKDNRGMIKNRMSIEQRPAIVYDRKRFGDLEVDLIIGKNHNQAIQTTNDRASGMLKMKKVAAKASVVVTKPVKELLEEWTPYIHTITADNGNEFACHIEVAQKLEIDYDFAHPNHSWERGSNENFNGLVRSILLKDQTSLTLMKSKSKTSNTIKQQDLSKRHQYENPIFVMNQLLFNPEVEFVT